MQSFNPFNTKARVVLAFDPDHLQKIEKEHLARIVEVAIDLSKIPGFRGCLPCAASGFDEFAWNSRVLPALREGQS
ncbi:hypothetical protein [Reyranella sp.]|uniref:hypothetical protein n=1 Tax=Reyranella sp. TaxID=1929291 RepID=UPI003D0EB745